jgi:hypothetical protein
MGNIKFEGRLPYALPIAQNVTARAEGAVVEMTLEVITPGKEPSIVPIKVQMTSDSARSLRAQLQPTSLGTQKEGGVVKKLGADFIHLSWGGCARGEHGSRARL